MVCRGLDDKLSGKTFVEICTRKGDLSTIHWESVEDGEYKLGAIT